VTPAAATPTVLVVEDEFLVQDVIQAGLEDGGFDVTVVSSGKEALAHLEDHALALRGLVTDIRLGAGPDGWEVARRARALNPKLPVVYMTGDSEAAWSSLGVPNSTLVVKPFAPMQIVVALATLANAMDTV
jgi:CheY-like chemotaxis protein